MADYTPTPEQAEVIASYSDGVDLVIQAGAGAGKSSTLKLVAASDPRRRMTYLAYNKSIATDAKKSFPPNTAASTCHGLAFQAVGRDYAHRLNGPRQTARDVADLLDVPGILDLRSPGQVTGDDGKLVPLAARRIARWALDTVQRFCQSGDAEMGLGHLPRLPNLTRPELREELGGLVLPVADAAWADIQRPGGRLAFSHDHYLKMWALTRPALPTDVLLLDEAQDTNGVVAKLVRDQVHAQRLLVGDSAQQIYSWRGAIDALERFADEGARMRCLSKSFRFGPAVAARANEWLHILGAPLRLTGHEPLASRLESPLLDADAVLTRSNAGAMGVVMERLRAGMKVALVGGSSDMQKLARASRDLQQGRETDHPQLAGFATWQQVREYSETEEDGADLRVLVRLIDDYGTDAILAATEALADEADAETVVSTAHKAKGREWDRVRIHDDFRPPARDKKGMLLVRAEEARLAYVAVTRARQVLDDHALGWVTAVDGVTA